MRVGASSENDAWEVTMEELLWGFPCSGVSTNVVQEF